jgi:hypothetical protein
MTKLDKIDLVFCKLCIIVKVNPCIFTQQLGVYRMAKPKARLKNMSVLGAKCVIVYPNLFTLHEQKLLNCY